MTLVAPISLRHVDPASELRHIYIEIENTNDAAEMAKVKVVPAGCYIEGGWFVSDTEVTQSQYVISVKESLSGDALLSQTFLNPDSSIAANTIKDLGSGTIQTTRFISGGTPITISVSTTTGGPDGNYTVCLKLAMDANAEVK